MSTFAVAWRTVTKRLIADWLVVGAVFISVLLAAALLAAGPIYADAVTLSALRRTIADAPATSAAMSVELTLFPRDLTSADQLTRQALANTFETTGVSVYGHIEAESYGLTDSSTSELTELVSLQYFEDIEDRASLVRGVWPEPSGNVTQAAVSTATAEAAGVEIGDRLAIENRLDPSVAPTVEVVGVFTIDDPNDPYWLDDALVIEGLSDSGSFRTFGPFIVDADTLTTDLAPARVSSSWRALPDFDDLTVAEVGRLREAADRTGERLELELTRALGDRAGATSGFNVVTDLPELLAGVDNSLTVTRSGVLALLFQLAILAGYALVLASGLLSDTRSAETALVRSRGSSPRQLVTSAFLEALLIAVPAAVAAPFLATWLLGILNRAGPLAAIDLTIDPTASAGAFALAALASLLAVVVLASTAFRAARAFPGGAVRRRRRQTAAPVSQRIGLDIALIALTVIALWQLQEVGPDVSARVRGQFGVDPLLVLAPALGLFAGTVLSLRVVPLLARIAEWLASTRKSTIPALASWQVARRPSRYTRSSFLLVMAIAIGFFAASYATSWIASQRDQAAFETGADVRVLPWQGEGAIGPMHLRAAHEATPGISRSMPVNTIVGQLGREGEVAEFLAIDTESAVEVVDIRPDLSPEWPELMAHLSSQRPHLASIELPGEPTEIGLTLSAVELIPTSDDFETCDFIPEGAEPDVEEVCFDAVLSVVLQDGNGLMHRIAVGDVPVNAGEARLSASLMHTTDGGASIAPIYPLSLVAIELRSSLPQLSSRKVLVSISAISAGSGEAQERLPIDFGDPAWRASANTFGHRSVSPSITRRVDLSEVLAIVVETGSGFTGAGSHFGLRPSGSDQPETIPVVLSESLADALGVSIGDTVRMPALGLRADSRVVGTFEAFPTTDPFRRGVVVLDLPTYQAMSYALGEPLPEPEEHWISTPRDHEGVLDALRTSPFNSFEVNSQQELTDRLTADPVALATIGALTFGFVAAAVFSIVGFSVTATVSARERLVEFALIRALGMSRRQLGGWLGLEQGALVVVSLALGTLVGVMLTAVLLPLVILTQAGTTPFPESAVIYPWQGILYLELAVVAALGIVVLVMTLLLRRIGLGSLLRMGED